MTIVLTHGRPEGLAHSGSDEADTEQVIKLADAVCADLLDQEYAALARHVVAKLARKRPSPLQSGRLAT